MRSARMRVRRPRGRRLAPFSVNRMVPNILTLLALCAGMTAIRFAVKGQFEYAVFSIIAAGIFDGRMRYNLRLAFKRLDKVKAEKGYQGPVVVCAIYFTPVAGYVPDRAAIKYLAAQRDMEVWLAPIAGTRVLVPFKTVIPTPLGTGMLVATEFVATPLPTRASAKAQ